MARLRELFNQKFRKREILFLCDRNKCNNEGCPSKECHHTTDITHARNFRKVSGVYVETEEE